MLAEKEQKVAAIAKQTALVQASQNKETTILVAEGNLEAEKNNAAAIQAIGISRAEAEKALQLAPVSAQISLTQEIGTNESYQKYHALIEAFKAYMPWAANKPNLFKMQILRSLPIGAAPQMVSRK